MPPLALVHARVITPEAEIADGTVVVVEGRIGQADERLPPDGVDVLDLRGFTVAPGFIDLHVHGGGGFSLIDGDATQVRGYARWAATRGVTGFLVTLVPEERRRMVEAIDSTVAAFDDVDGARPLGINLEGPFLNPLRCGALKGDVLRPADVDELREYLLAARGLLRLMTIAPELPGADALVAATQVFSIPVNKLHAKGFLSIGCAPCTRAIEPGEDERAGRWWWEEDNKKECGLHVGKDGVLRRGPAPQETEAFQ